MSNGFDKLKSIGAQKIHEQTHIARHHAQALLHESFDGMNKIQLLGFISILEREYSVDLTTLRNKAEQYFSEEVEKEEEEEAKVFVAPKKKKSYTLFYILIVIVVFIVGIMFTLSTTPPTINTIEVSKIDDTAIEIAQDSMSNNTTSKIDENLSAKITSQPKEIEKKSFKIMTNTKLWVGYIDLSTYKKYQKIFNGELDLDPTKEWLLTLGHGYVSVEIDGKTTEFKSKNTLRLLYKDNKLEKISFKEHQELNKGSKW